MNALPHADPWLPATALLTAICLIACAPTQPPAAPILPAPNPHWVQVGTHPPTYYPRGIAVDCPTDCHSGEWVDAGDAAGRRFFIPFRSGGGIPRQTLVREAWSARSAEQVRRITAEDRAILRQNVSDAILYGPLVGTGIAALGLVTMGHVPDFERMQEEWRSSKLPHK